MTDINTAGAAADIPASSGRFSRCSKCSMQVLRSEMDIHLAHGHNIGPSTEKKDKGKGGRGKPRRSYGD